MSPRDGTGGGERDPLRAEPVLGLMQDDFPLTLGHVLWRMRTMHGHASVGTLTGDSLRRRGYDSVVERVDRLAHALGALGIGPGDRVGTLAWNTDRHLELYLAVPCAGAVLHTLNARLTDEHLAYVIDQAADRVLFVDASLLEVVERIAPRLRTVEAVVALDAGSGAGDALDYEQLLGSAPGEAYAYPMLDERRAAGLCFTSGTTGAPKGVLYSHRSMLLHALAQCTSDGVGISGDDRVLVVAPMFHVNGWGLPYSSALAGADLVLPGEQVRADRLADAIETERVTVAAAVPTVWLDLLRLAEERPVDLSSLRMLLTGGAPVPRALIEAFDRLGVPMVQSWGMTETLSINLVARPPAAAAPEEAWRRRDTAGRLQPLVEARLVDDDGREVAWDGESAGHLQVSGPLVASRYFADDAAPEDRFDGGWLRTGDVASVDAQGYVRIVDRSKDLIKSGGEWISSVDLERHLAAHPAVATAAVIARGDERWGERPVAFVVASGCDEDALRAHLAGRVPRWWIPDDWLFVRELPLTSVGKLDKKALRRDLEARRKGSR